MVLGALDVPEAEGGKQTLGQGNKGQGEKNNHVSPMAVAVATRSHLCMHSSSFRQKRTGSFHSCNLTLGTMNFTGRALSKPCSEER